MSSSDLRWPGKAASRTSSSVNAVSAETLSRLAAGLSPSWSPGDAGVRRAVCGGTSPCYSRTFPMFGQTPDRIGGIRRGHFEYQICHLKRLRAATNRFMADALMKTSLFAISFDVFQSQIITRTVILQQSFIFGHTDVNHPILAHLLPHSA